jgi:hypothetical protein
MSESAEKTGGSEVISDAFRKARLRRSVVLGILLGLGVLAGGVKAGCFGSEKQANTIRQFDFIEEIDKDLQSGDNGRKTEKAKDKKEVKPNTDSKAKKTKKKSAKQDAKDEDDFLPPEAALA